MRKFREYEETCRQKENTSSDLHKVKEKTQVETHRQKEKALVQTNRGKEKTQGQASKQDDSKSMLGICV